MTHARVAEVETQDEDSRASNGRVVKRHVCALHCETDSSKKIIRLVRMQDVEVFQGKVFGRRDDVLAKRLDSTPAGRDTGKNIRNLHLT